MQWVCLRVARMGTRLGKTVITAGRPVPVPVYSVLHVRVVQWWGTGSGWWGKGWGYGVMGMGYGTGYGVRVLVHCAGLYYTVPGWHYTVPDYTVPGWHYTVPGYTVPGCCTGYTVPGCCTGLGAVPVTVTGLGAVPLVPNGRVCYPYTLPLRAWLARGYRSQGIGVRSACQS